MMEKLAFSNGNNHSDHLRPTHLSSAAISLPSQSPLPSSSTPGAGPDQSRENYDSDDGASGIVIPRDGNDRRLSSRKLDIPRLKRGEEGISFIGINGLWRKGKMGKGGTQNEIDAKSAIDENNALPERQGNRERDATGKAGIISAEDSRIRTIVVVNNVGWLCATGNFDDYPRISLLCDEVSAFEDSAEKGARALRKEIKYGKGDAQERGSRLMGILFLHTTLRFRLHLASSRFLQVIEATFESPKTSLNVKAMLLKAISAMSCISQNDPRLSLVLATLIRMKSSSHLHSLIGQQAIHESDLEQTIFTIGTPKSNKNARRQQPQRQTQNQHPNQNQNGVDDIRGSGRSGLGTGTVEPSIQRLDSHFQARPHQETQEWQSLDLTLADYYPPYSVATSSQPTFPSIQTAQPRKSMDGHVHTSLMYPEPA